MEIKKTNSARLDNKRGTFFLLGMVMTLSFVFVGLQYQNHASDSDLDSDDLEDLAQDFEMNMPAEQRIWYRQKLLLRPFLNPLRKR